MPNMAILSSGKESRRDCGNKSPVKHRYTKFCRELNVLRACLPRHNKLGKIYFLYDAGEIRHMLIIGCRGRGHSNDGAEILVSLGDSGVKERN